MATSYTGLRVQDTYNAIIKIGDNSNLSGTAKLLSDGLGNDSPLYLSGTRLGIGISPAYQFHTSGNAKIGGNLIISGNLTVNGTLTYLNVTDLQVEDPLIKLAKDNTSNTLDIGFFGKYVESATTKYTGLFWDASTNKFRLFEGLQVEPSTTIVDVTGTGYTRSLLNADLEGNVTGTVSSLSNHDTNDLVEGSFNLYYTNARADARVNLQTGANLDLSSKDTDDLSEGSTNLYFTTARARASFSAGDGITITNGVIASEGDAEVAKRLEVTVKNVSGGSLAKGVVVHAAPTATPPSGNVIEVVSADANVAASMPAIGVLNETIADEAEGEAVMFGAVSGIDTSSFTAGDELYVSETAGAFTATKPTAFTSQVQKIAIVLKVHASNGSIKVFGAGRSNDVPNRVDRDMNFTDDSELTFGDSSDLKIYHTTNNIVRINSGDLIFNSFVTDGDIKFQLDNGSGSLTEYMRLDGGTENIVFTKPISATSATFTNSLTVNGNITTDGIFINESAPDDEVVQFIQSGRKTALKTFFSSSSTGSYLDFRISNGNVDGSYSSPLRLYPDQVNINGKGVITTLMTNAIEKATTGQPITINSGSDASLGLRVYYDMQVYNSISFTDASWNTQGQITGYNGNLNMRGGSGTNTIIINSTDQVKIRSNADLGTYTRLGIAMDVAGNAANLDESTDYNAMSIAPYRVGSSYGMYFGGGHGSSESAGFIQSAKTDGTDSSTISLNPFGGAVGINTGTSDPSSTLHIKGSFRTHSTGTYPMGILNEFVSQYVSRTKFGNIGSSSNLEIYYDIAGTEEARITRNYTVAPLKFMRGTTTDMEITGTGNVLIPGEGKYIRYGSYSYIGESLEDLHSLTIASDSTESIRFSHYNRTTSAYELNMIIKDNSRVGIGTDNPSTLLSLNSVLNGSLGGISLIGNGAGDKLNIWVQDIHSKLLHTENSTDAVNGYGRIDFETNAAVNATHPTRGGFSFKTAGAGQFVTFTNTGRVGINTTTPDTDLHITTNGTSSEDGIVKIGGSVASLGLVLEYDQVGATFSYITANPTYTSDTSIMKIRVDGDRNVNQLVLLGNGHIGMGRNDPNGNLEIITSSTVSGVSDTVNNVLIGLQSANRPTIILDTADTTYTNRTWNITNVGSAGSLFIGRNGLDAMIMKNNGYIGVGADPSVKFHIQDGAGGGNPTDSRTKLYINSSGEAYIGINVPTNSFGGMRLAAGGGNKAFFELYDNTTQGQKLSLGTIDARDVVINTNNTDRVRIKDDGSVGINCDPGDMQLKVTQTRAGEWTGGFVNETSNAYGLYVDTSQATGTTYNFTCYTNTGAGMALNGAGRLHVGNLTSFNSKLSVSSDSTALKAFEAHKPYSSSRNIASFTHGNNFVRNSYDTFTIAQTDVPCLVITETVNNSSQGSEQRLTLTVGDNKCVIGTSSTVTAGMYFNVARSTSAVGYQETNGITALRLRNDGEAIFANNIQVQDSIYLANYIYHLGDTNTYLRFTEDTFTFRTGGNDRAILNNNALNVGPHGTTSSTVNDGPLRVCNNSTGNNDMGRGSVAIQLGPKTTRTATAGNLYGGITWNGLLNYGNGTNYDIAPHVWVGAKYKDFPGSERSSFVVGVKSGTGSTGSGNNIPVERLEIDYTGKMTVSGNILATGSITANGDVIAFSDKRLKENIKPIDNALEKITKLEGVSYNRIDIDDKSNKVGFIAQDVKKVLPEVVSDNEKYLGVNYSNITAVLVEAIKEQQKQIVSLQNEINKLKNK